MKLVIPVSDRTSLLANQKEIGLNKKILLGVSGGIAAYKSADLVRRLVERGFQVRVVMTPSATEFITPMTLQAVSGNPVNIEQFDEQMEAAMGHIELARWADFLLIAPATANTIAKLVHGEADNLLTTIVLASKAPLILAPAMNQQMWANPATRRNLALLGEMGAQFLGPAEGEQACGDVGLGRMLEPVEIADKMVQVSRREKILAGKKLLLTAGPTIEAIDPVRFISNHSSGKMGYALARAAQLFGAEVTLVSGPTNLPNPPSVKLISIKSAAQMLEQVKQAIDGCDIFIGCAAVADYTPVSVAEHKIKKADELMTISLKRNADILSWVSSQHPRPFVVGFAAESQSVKKFAQSKLEKKNLDMICANDISLPGLGFNSDNNQLLLLDKSGNELLLDIASKEILAERIIQEISIRINQ